MRRLLLANLLLAAATPAVGLDLCPVYGAVHTAEILPRLQSGVPFKILSVAVGTDGTVFRRIVRLEYDLWSENVAVEVLGHGSEGAKLAVAQNVICKAISFPEAPLTQTYQYKLLLNPVMGDGLKRLRAGEVGSGLLQVNWDHLIKELETEKVLLSREVKP